jgi:hypothetical protein
MRSDTLEIVAIEVAAFGFGLDRRIYQALAIDGFSKCQSESDGCDRLEV